MHITSAPPFLALEPESFSTTAAYSFVFSAWECDNSLSACVLHLLKDGSSRKVFLVHT